MKNRKVFLICMFAVMVAISGCGITSDSGSSDTSSDNNTSDTSGDNNTTDNSKTLTNEGDSFKYSDIGPAVDQDTTVTITPEDINTAYKYKVETTRTNGSGAIKYNNGISAGSGTISMTSGFTGEKSFTLSYAGSGDTFDIKVSVLNSNTDAVLSTVTFNVTVE